jgi:hypothetical protein
LQRNPVKCDDDGVVVARNRPVTPSKQTNRLLLEI